MFVLFFILILDKCVAFGLIVQNYCICLKPDLISPGNTLLAVRAPAGTQLEVPIPKAVSVEPLDATIEWCFIMDDLKATIVHLIPSGAKQPCKVPDLSEEHQWANRCPAAEQMHCRLLYCCAASSTAWGHFTERRINQVHFRSSRGKYLSVSGFVQRQTQQHVGT